MWTRAIPVGLTVVSDETTLLTPRRLAKHLKEVRRRAGVSQADMAERMHRTQSWVSLIERGQISVTSDLLAKWCDALDLTPEARASITDDFSLESDKYIGWQLVWKDGPDVVQRQRGELEKSSEHLRLFQSTFVHSLLQTPQYIEAIYHAMRFFPDDSHLTDYLQARLARQAAILHASDKRIDALFTEAALRSMMATRDVMAAQMEYLAKLSERGLVNIAIHPLSERLTVLPHSSWDVFDETVAVVELVSGQVTFSEPGELALYIDTFELLWDDALQGEAAQEMLWNLAREFEQGKSDDS